MNWELLLKHINKETDTVEEQQVENWLNEQAENRQLLDYLIKRKVQLEHPLKQSDIDEQWVHLLNRIFETDAFNKKPYPFKHWLLSIAASLLLLSAGVWYYTKIARNNAGAQMITLQTPANRSGKATLIDGTKVFMAPGTTITYNSTFNENKRELTLTGEAFFNVKHDTHKPFIIHTINKLAISVLGTSFNVYAIQYRPSEVKVATGLVGIMANNQTVFVKAGEQYTYNESEHKAVLAHVELKDAAARENGSLFFKDDDCYAIAEKLHRWYNITVQTMPSAKKHPRFSGEMEDTGLDNVLNGLHYATGLHYRYTQTHTLLIF